jgi:hypothetical protein
VSGTMTNQVSEQGFQKLRLCSVLPTNRLLNDRTGYRVFTNALEIRQAFEWQTDRGTESLAFRVEIHLLEFYITGIADQKCVKKPTHSYVTVRKGKRNFNLFGAIEFLRCFNRERFMTYPITHSALLGSSSLLESGDHIPIARMEEMRFWKSRFD